MFLQQFLVDGVLGVEVRLMYSSVEGHLRRLVTEISAYVERRFFFLFFN